MEQCLINAYLMLVEEVPSLSGEEWRENRDRRKRMNKRSLQEYGITISCLILSKL